MKIAVSSVAIVAVTSMIVSCGGGGGSSPTPPTPPTPDTTAPDTTLSNAPPALTNASSATFTFTANESATFEVRLDGSAFAVATSPHALNNLADGSHTLEVRARDTAGNLDATPASATWVVDTAPPDTQISVAPASLTNAVTANFTATSPDAGATFEVSVDGAAFVAAAMPYTLAGVAGGTHNVAIRARDAAGNVDSSPATHQWVVDNVAPDVLVSQQPPAFTNTATATIGFFTTETPTTFEASVDGAAYGAVTSPLQLVNLAAGAHQVLVRASDVVGNVDASPAAVNWRVDITPPAVAVVFPTAVSYTDAATLTVRGTASDNGEVGEVLVGAVAATSTDQFAHWSAVIPVVVGTSYVTVTVRDRAGNAGTTLSSPSLTVINQGAVLSQTLDMDYDPTGDRLIVSDLDSQAVLAFRASDGTGSVISSSDRSATPNNSTLLALTVDAANNRALAVDSSADALVAVNLATGARTILSSGSAGAPTSIFTGFGITHDAANNRVFVIVRDTGSVVAIDLANQGARSVISSPTVGTGPVFERAMSIAFDALTGTHLYVGDAAVINPTIYQVDVSSGNRVVFSQSIPVGMAQGPSFIEPSSLRMDPAHFFLYLVDGNGAVLRMLLNGSGRGTREFVASNLPGGGTGEPIVGGLAGLALKTTASPNQLYVGQGSGEILAMNIATANHDRTALVQSRVGSGVRPSSPRAIALEQTSGAAASLLYLSPNLSIMRVSLASGDRTLVSGSGVGQGPAFVSPSGLVLDTRANGTGSAALVLDSNGGAGRILSVNLASGDRTAIGTIGTVNFARSLSLDAAANRVLFTDDVNSSNGDTLYSVDLASSVRSVISGPARGAGTPFIGASGFILEPAVNPTRAIVVATNPSRVVAVDLASGDRSEFISNQGLMRLTTVGPLFLDTARSRVLGTNVYRPNLFAVPLPVADPQMRSMISGVSSIGNFASRGTGPLPEGVTGLDVNVESQVAFVSASRSDAILAIDLVSGDRVIISH